MEDSFPERSVGRWVSVLYRFGGVYIGNRLSHLGLGNGAIQFLAYLYLRDGRSQDELATILAIDKGTTTRALHRLESRGLIERRMDNADRRVNRIFLTDKAREHEDEVWAALYDWREALLQGFSVDEREELLSFLRRLVDNAKDAVHDLERP